MIQDILPEHFYNQYERREPDADSRVLLFAEDGIYVSAALPQAQGSGEVSERRGTSGSGEASGCGEPFEFPCYRELATLCGMRGYPMPELIYLFAVEKETYFLAVPEDVQNIVRAAAETPQTEGMLCLRRMSMFEVRAMRPKKQVLAAATAWHLFCWYKDNRFCGRCGGLTRHGETLRMLECPACGNQIFPKIAPAVIVGVTDGERILMTKYAGRAYKRYALIAGFTEIGETAEETVRREVMEEVGLHVKNIRYYKSQPWGFDSNLLLGFFCELDGAGEIALDTEELAVAEWVNWRDIPDDTEGLSLTGEMMTAFRERCRRNP